MSIAAALSGQFGGPAGENSPKARHALLFSLLSVVVVLTISASIYVHSTKELFTLNKPGGVNQWEENSALMRHFDQSVLRIMIATAVGGGGCLAASILAMAVWRRTWQQRLTVTQDESRSTITSLHLQLVEAQQSAKVLGEAQTRGQELLTRQVHANTQLRTELDSLKRTEKNLSQRRQELESSKTVLELHVEERTRELRKLQRRYEMILNSAGEGICGFDSDGKASFVNPAVVRITGWSLEELLGKTEEEIFGPGVDSGQEKSAPKHFEERVFSRKDGRTLPVECIRTAIEEDGKVVGGVVVFKDITERKRVEEAIAQKAAELSRSNKELEQFAFVASHDLQEPLRKIQAFGDRLKSKIKGSIAADAQDYLERMQNASERMRTLINDLLTFSRVIRSSEPFVPVDLGAVAKGVVGDLEVRIEKTGAQIHLGDLPVIEADPTQMHQLLLNLLGNALKFQAPGAKPLLQVFSRTFQALSGESYCELSVQDNGIGFEEKYLEKMFAVFQRLHGRNEYEGTGVGLAVCRRIADRHHGTITATSQLGQGATFVVTLPMKQTKEKTL